MTVLPLTRPCQLAKHARDVACGDGPRSHLEVLGRLRVFGFTHDLVEFDSERIGDELHRFGEHRRAFGHFRLQVRIVDVHAEAGGSLGVGRVVQRGVGGLGDDHLVHPIAGGRRDDGQQVCEPGADAGTEHRRTALLARLLDAVAVGTQVLPGDERGGRHDVHTRRQDAHQLVDVLPHRVVDDAVGFERQQRIHVVRRRDAERLDADQLADVDTALVLRPGVAPDEFIVRVPGDRLDGALSDISRRPLDDPVWGGVWHSLSIGKTGRPQRCLSATKLTLAVRTPASPCRCAADRSCRSR